MVTMVMPQNKIVSLVVVMMEEQLTQAAIPLDTVLALLVLEDRDVICALYVKIISKYNCLQIALSFFSLVIGTSLMEWAVFHVHVQEVASATTVMR